MQIKRKEGRKEGRKGRGKKPVGSRLENVRKIRAKGRGWEGQRPPAKVGLWIHPLVSHARRISENSSSPLLLRLIVEVWYDTLTVRAFSETGGGRGREREREREGEDGTSAYAAWIKHFRETRKTLCSSPFHHRFFFSSASFSFHLFSPPPFSLLAFRGFWGWMREREIRPSWSQSRGENIDVAKWMVVSWWGVVFFLKGGGQLVIEYFGELIVQNLVSNSIKLDEKIKIMRSVFY